MNTATVFNCDRTSFDRYPLSSHIFIYRRMRRLLQQRYPVLVKRVFGRSPGVANTAFARYKLKPHASVQILSARLCPVVAAVARKVA